VPYDKAKLLTSKSSPQVVRYSKVHRTSTNSWQWQSVTDPSTVIALPIHLWTKEQSDAPCTAELFLAQLPSVQVPQHSFTF